MLPDDVKKLASAVIAHRCLLHPESALRGATVNDIIAGIVEEVPLALGDI